MTKLKELRKRAGITALDLAQQIGVRETTVLRWEAGTHAPASRYIAPLADALDVTADELLGREVA